jgi:hypothetical protein
VGDRRAVDGVSAAEKKGRRRSGSDGGRLKKDRSHILFNVRPVVA